MPQRSYGISVGKSHDMNVGKIWTHWESNSRPLECITWHAPLLHHMPLQSTFMFPGLPINRIYPLSTMLHYVILSWNHFSQCPCYMLSSLFYILHLSPHC